MTLTEKLLETHNKFLEKNAKLLPTAREMRPAQRVPTTT